MSNTEMTTSMKIMTVNALAGAGKTFSASRWAARSAATGQKYLLVQPTVELITETEAIMRSFAPDLTVTAIHSGTTQHVVRDIMERTRTSPTGLGEMVLVTHAAFERVPYWANAHEWNVIVDEVIQADRSFDFNLPNTHDLVTRAIGTVGHDFRYARVVPSDLEYLEALARNRGGDEVYDRFSGFAATLLSAHWDTFVGDSAYHALVTGHHEGRGKLLAFASLNPSIFAPFRSATVMGACLAESMMYQLWRERGVDFQPHRAIEAGLQFSAHPNDHLLTILYCFDEPWSKSQRDQIVDADAGKVRLLDALVPEIAKEFAGQPFVWLGNKDLPDSFLSNQGIRLPNTPHGLNRYRHINNCVVLSALNPVPGHFKFLSTRGIDASAVRDAHYHQAIYQAVMRTSLRDPASVVPKKLIVMDKPAAEWLLQVFPRAAVGRLGSAVQPVVRRAGRPRKHADAAERQRAYRERRRLQKLAELDAVNQGDAAPTSVSVFGSIYDPVPEVTLSYADIDAFIAELREAWAQSVDGKDDNALLSPATFDANLAEDTSRGLANVRAVHGIWLDNDGGDLSYRRFARLFPRLQMVFMNTHSTTARNARYRVFIPTALAMTPTVHQEILLTIEQVLNHEGYYSPKQIDVARAVGRSVSGRKLHGFDLSKFAANSLFYMPSQAADAPASFFEELRDTPRQVLDPYTWINNSIIPDRDPEAQNALPPIAEQRLGDVGSQDRQVHRAIEIYTATPRGCGLGHGAVMALVRRLSNAGLTLGEVRFQAQQGLARRPRRDGKREVADAIQMVLRTPRVA